MAKKQQCTWENYREWVCNVREMLADSHMRYRAHTKPKIKSKYIRSNKVTRWRVDLIQLVQCLRYQLHQIHYPRLQNLANNNNSSPTTIEIWVVDIWVVTSSAHSLWQERTAQQPISNRFKSNRAQISIQPPDETITAVMYPIALVSNWL